MDFSGTVLGSNPLVSVDREGQASWASPSCHFAVETFNVGGWLTHGDLALEARVDFLAVFNMVTRVLILILSSSH